MIRHLRAALFTAALFSLVGCASTVQQNDGGTNDTMVPEASSTDSSLGVLDASSETGSVADAGPSRDDGVPVADALPPVDARMCPETRSDSPCQAYLTWSPASCEPPPDLVPMNGEPTAEICARFCPTLTGSQPLSCRAYTGHGVQFLTCTRCM